MPNNKYNNRDLVSVPVGNDLIYLFNTNVDTEERANLGHTAVADVTPPLAFLGGDSPKPRRVRRRTADGWNSSFCAEVPATIAALKTAGWNVGKSQPKKRGIVTGGTARAVSVYVIVRGIRYAWNMPLETRAAIGEAALTALGISIATNADVPLLVWGCSLPRPARVKLVRTATGGTGPAPLGGTVDNLSTFCGQAQEDNLPAGWSIYQPRLMFPGDPATVTP
jgi:hypothetical protein